MVGAKMTLQHSISTSDYNHNDPSNSHIKDMSAYDQLNYLLRKSVSPYIVSPLAVEYPHLASFTGNLISVVYTTTRTYIVVAFTA